ncbi:MAG: hypothetical protein NDI60_08190 [Elusimicrobiales bacterium]|nr:hypothetical protein [Elusimicrobiales bacterium]
MKLFIALALALCAPLTASAQEFLVGDEIFKLYSRPFRDRTERFQSARVDALQMHLAVDDESDQLTLENWADNRADLKAGESKIKVEANTTGGEEYTPSEWDVSGNRLGALGRFGRLEFEGLYIAQKSERLNTTTRNEFNKTAAGAAFAFGPESLSFGVHANMNRSGDEDWEEVTDNNSLGAAVIMRTDLYELGATADYVGRGTKDDSANYDVPRNGPQFGAQAMLKPLKGLKAALRASAAMLEGDGANNGATEYENYEVDHKELGARLEWRLEKLPLTFGLEYSKVLYDVSYTASGVLNETENEYSLKTAGAALRLLGDRLLLGLELQDLQLDMSGNESEGRTLTGGAELWVLPGLALRASVQKMRTETATSESDNNTLAAGVGFKGEKFTLDGALRRTTQDEDAADPDKYTDIRLTFGMKF